MYRREAAHKQVLCYRLQKKVSLSEKGYPVIAA